MLRSHNVPFKIVLLATVGMASPSAYGQAARDFYAEQVIISQGQLQEGMKLHVSGQKTRSEMTSPGGVVTITRRDLRLSWILYPESKTYTERALTSQDLSPVQGTIPGEISRERIGREHIQGYACTKYRVTYRGPRGTGEALVWHAAPLGIPIRIEMSDDLVSELQNIQTRPQPGYLFEVPRGYSQAAARGFGNPRTILSLLLDRSGRSKQAAVPQREGASRPERVPGKTTVKPPVQDFAMDLNMDRPGGDYRDFDLERADPNICAAACSKEAPCRAWSYIKPGFQGAKARCWLKNEVPEQMENEGCISGLKGALGAGIFPAALEFNTNRYGSDYGDMSLKSPDARLCQAACERDPKCLAWTYVKPGVSGESAHCWLKDEVPEPSEDENCISGVKAKKVSRPRPPN